MLNVKSTENRRILVVRLTSLGDVVRITGCLAAIRRVRPGSEILLVTHRAYQSLFRNNPDVNYLVPCSDAENLIQLWRDARQKIKPLRRGGSIDLAIDLQGTRASAAWIYASRARRMAGRGGWRPGWTFSVRPDHRISDVWESASILERLDLPVDDPSPVLRTDPDADQALGNRLAAAGLPADGFLAVNPCSRWRSKEWPARNYVEVLSRLHASSGVPCVLTGTASEADAIEGIRASLPPGAAFSMAGRLSLDELACLLRRSALLLTGDSGPMHMAAAVGTPVIALFGPTWPERSGPWGRAHLVLQQQRADHFHAYRDPAAASLMQSIAPDDVYRALVDRLAAGKLRQ